MRPLRILATGSRNWRDRLIIAHGLLDVLTMHKPFDSAVLIHGGQVSTDPTTREKFGADYLAGEAWRALAAFFGAERLHRPEVHPADWDKYGRRAGMVRNVEMVQTRPDVCVAFPLGESCGTRHCMATAEKAGIPVISYEAAS